MNEQNNNNNNNNNNNSLKHKIKSYQPKLEFLNTNIYQPKADMQ